MSSKCKIIWIRSNPQAPRYLEMSHLVPGNSQGDKHHENTFLKYQLFNVG